MEENTLVESSYSATIHAPIEKVDIAEWCFTLPESEYQKASLKRRVSTACSAPSCRGSWESTVYS